jgi:hypothetical protein
MNRVKLVLLLPLLFLDCLGNMIIGGSPRNTLSGEAWHHRDHPVWGWCEPFICEIFNDPNHCKNAAAEEEKFGGWFASWRARWSKA